MAGDWFRYARGPGRISGAPNNAKGWAALIGFMTAMPLLSMLASRLAAQLHPIAGVAAPLAVLGCGLWWFFRHVVLRFGTEQR